MKYNTIMKSAIGLLGSLGHSLHRSVTGFPLLQNRRSLVAPLGQSSRH
jgi:hypothetical protein